MVTASIAAITAAVIFDFLIILHSSFLSDVFISCFLGNYSTLFYFVYISMSKYILTGQNCVTVQTLAGGISKNDEF